MTSDNHIAQVSVWAKQRVDEIEATLKAVEARLGTLSAEAKTAAEQAMSEMRLQRDVFQKAIRDQQHEGEAAWAKGRAALETNWAAFEATVQTYMKQARETAEQQQAMFKVRAEAQRKAWQASMDDFIRQANSFAAAKKPDLDAAIARAKTEAEAAKSKLEASAKAGGQSWDAMKAALEESRVAFEKAGKKALEAFQQAS